MDHKTAKIQLKTQVCRTRSAAEQLFLLSNIRLAVDKNDHDGARSRSGEDENDEQDEPDVARRTLRVVFDPAKDPVKDSSQPFSFDTDDDDDEIA